MVPRADLEVVVQVVLVLNEQAVPVRADEQGRLRRDSANGEQGKNGGRCEKANSSHGAKLAPAAHDSLTRGGDSSSSSSQARMRSGSPSRSSIRARSSRCTASTTMALSPS